MIVIEGPDLAGKTTLAEALFQRITREERTRHPMVRHFTKVLPHFDKFWGYQQCCQRDVIIDRFHLSHVIYRHVGDEQHHLDPCRYRMVDAEITRVGGLIVLVAPQPDIIAARYDSLQRPEMYDRDYILRVAAEFHKLTLTREIETATGVYQPRVDMAFTQGQPTLEMVGMIMGEWCLRQMVLDQICGQRPGTI